MGTKHLIVVKLDGEYKLAQYGCCDGYPSGQGSTVLNFLANWDRPTFEAKLRAASFMTEAEVEAMDEMPEDFQRWPQLDSGTGAEILAIVQNAPPGMKLVNRIDFVRDSLYCEWGYVLDLDANTLEVFEGFNTFPLPEGERFAYMEPYDCDGPRETFYPIRKVAGYALASLPTVEAMERDCLRTKRRKKRMPNSK
jgi:hypothetical protein